MEEDFCFVIMPFKEGEFKDFYKYQLKSIIEDAGLKCIRADEILGEGSILKDIVIYIQKARLIIADLSTTNPNVMYELGVAHALDRKVIMLSQNIEKELPFDVKSYKVIQYETSSKGLGILRKKITDIIKTFDEWSKQSGNPVQDFLDDAYLSTNGKELTELKHLVEEKENKLRETESRLQELRRLTDKLLQYHGSQEGVSSEEKLKQVIDEVEMRGEVTVPVDSRSGTHTKTGKTQRKKIKFRKIT